MLSAEEAAGYKSLVDSVLFIHKYTRESFADGAEDTWRMINPNYGAPSVDVSCNYLSNGFLSTREKSVTSVESPTITVKSDDILKVGDRVTNIKDSTGMIVLTGPLYVEVIAPAMGFGFVVCKAATLGGQKPEKW